MTILFHGSRAYFNVFDEQYIGTGEGAGVGVGFYFVSSLKGAVNHALRYSKGSGEALVYVCSIAPSAKIAYFGKSIDSHDSKIRNIWNTLPLSASLNIGDDWYTKLLSTTTYCPSFSQEHYVYDDLTRCEYLRDIGVDVVMDFESGMMAENYLHSNSHLVLNPAVIEIEEIIPVDAIETEVYGSAKKYVLKDDKAKLGDTDYLSRLRCVS